MAQLRSTDENSSNPDKALSRLKEENRFTKQKYKTLLFNTPKNLNKVRVVLISDTHSKIESNKDFVLPEADILIHAGDFTRHGTIEEIEKFSRYLDSLKHIQFKVIIAGNHERALDPKQNSSKVEKAKEILKNHIYLQDDGINLFGINIWGSPWQPWHCGNAFQLHRGEKLFKKWELIPENTDILVTHSPPLGYGDSYHENHHAGCVDLYNAVKYKIKPKYHVFGHIHEDYGAWTDGQINFINASICDRNYKPNREPVLFDIESEIFDSNKTESQP